GAAIQRLPVREPEQEAGGVQVARPRGVDDLVDAGRRDLVGLFARNDDRAVLAAGDGGERAGHAEPVDRTLEIPGIQREELSLVGKQNIDLAPVEELGELVAPVLYTERI